MKKLYRVNIFGDSESHFEEYYSDEEIETIMKFFNDMDKHDVASYDVPLVEFEKDGEIITREDYYDEDDDNFKCIYDCPNCEINRVCCRCEYTDEELNELAK